MNKILLLGFSVLLSCAAGTVKLFTKYGCNKISALCNKTEQTDAIFNMSFNRTCCNFNLC